MNDYFTRDCISNGFFTTINLINYAKRHDVENLGIVEIEEVPLYEDKNGLYFGTELLLNDYGESLVLFNISDVTPINDVLNSRKSVYLTELEKHLLSKTKESKLFKDVYNQENLSINYACKLLIKLGYYKGFKDSFDGFIKPFLNKMPAISKKQLNILNNNSRVYFCIDSIDKIISNNFIKNIDKFYGILYYGDVSLQTRSKLISVCNERNLDLRFGTNFSDHRLGESIGVRIE